MLGVKQQTGKFFGKPTARILFIKRRIPGFLALYMGYVKFK